MAPQMENAIRSLTRKVGIAISRNSRGGHQTGGVKPLGRLLLELKNLIPKGTGVTGTRCWSNPLER